MTDDSSSPPCVPSLDRTNEKKSSSWNFDDLHDENSVDTSADFFSVLKQNIEKNVYFNQSNPVEQLPSSKTYPTTQRFDSSNLISRCKQFLPLLTDANRNLFSKIQAGENVRIELDDDDDETNEQEQAIEMNLMFCPNVDSSSSSDSETDESDNEIQSIRLPQKAQSNSINIVEINPSNQFEDNTDN